MHDHRVDAPERGGQLGQAEGVDDAPGRPHGRPRPRRRACRRDPRPELPERDVMLRVAGEARVEDRAHAVADARARPPVPRPSRRGARPAARGSGSRAGRGTPRAGRASPRYRSGPLDAGDPLGRAGDDAGDDVAVAAQELGRRFDDEVRAELERAADVGRGERVVDDVRRAVAMGQLGERGVIGDVGRRVGDGLGVQDAGRAPRRGPRRPRRGRSCRRCRPAPRSRRTRG